MTLQYVAIDDEPLALEILLRHASEVPNLQLLKTFDDAVAALSFLQGNKVDLLFIDIEMPDILGVDLIKSLTKKPLIIFTTAYKEYAVEGFEVDAVDYLLKPISLERFKKAVIKAIDYYSYEKSKVPFPSHFYIRTGYTTVKINFDEIEYIEAMEDYIKIHLINNKPVVALMTLKSTLEKIGEEKFLRIHRSYIVSIFQIKSFSGKIILMNSSLQLPIGDTYSSSVLQKLAKRIQ